MKQKLLTRLILGTFAGVAVTGAAYAGQIQSSSVSIAREVITTDAQTITSPSIAYRFSGDVDARVQSQTFQVQFIISGTAEWAVAPGATTISVSDGVTGALASQSSGANVGDYTVNAIALSTDKKTVWVTITVNNTATALAGTGAAGAPVQLIKQPLISMNVTSNLLSTGPAPTTTAVGAARGTTTKLFSVVGDLVADYNTAAKCTDVKTLPVSFKHYTALTNPAALATDTTATADEHVRGGATNTATLMTFPTNIKVNVAPSTGDAKVSVAGANLIFTGTTGTSWVDSTRAMLGSVTLSQNAVGYDSDLAHQYVLAGVASGADAAGLDHITTATSNVGDVEVNTVTVTVSAANGFVNGGTLSLQNSAVCAGGGAIMSNGGAATAITAGTAAGPIALTIGNAQVNGAFGATGVGPVYVCYGVAGVTTPIPLSSFAAVGRVNKAASGGTLNEQDNICNGNLYSLGGGVKIDVRNYADNRERLISGWQSVVRLINNSETRTIDVWGQYIYADGSYGRWGKLTDLAPRAVLNMSSAQVDAALVSAPTHATSTAGTPAIDTVRGAPRLRITSNAGSTLRVQNYLANPNGTYIEASSSQAVDFEGTTDRAPASDGQYISQDAFKGLNGN